MTEPFWLEPRGPGPRRDPVPMPIALQSSGGLTGHAEGESLRRGEGIALSRSESNEHVGYANGAEHAGYLGRPTQESPSPTGAGRICGESRWSRWQSAIVVGRPTTIALCLRLWAGSALLEPDGGVGGEVAVDVGAGQQYPAVRDRDRFSADIRQHRDVAIAEGNDVVPGA